MYVPPPPLTSSLLRLLSTIFVITLAATGCRRDRAGGVRNRHAQREQVQIPLTCGTSVATAVLQFDTGARKLL